MWLPKGVFHSTKTARHLGESYFVLRFAYPSATVLSAKLARTLAFPSGEGVGEYRRMRCFPRVRLYLHKRPTLPRRVGVYSRRERAVIGFLYGLSPPATSIGSSFFAKKLD